MAYPLRTSKIQELVDFYNSTDYMMAEHFSNISPKIVMDYLTKNRGKIEDIIIIRKK